MLGNTGVKNLVDHAFTQLQVCSLAANEIGPAGARHIGRALRNPYCTVETLILDSNYIADDGLIDLAEGLKENTSVKTLDLRYNYIHTRGLKTLLEVLEKHNKTLDKRRHVPPLDVFSRLNTNTSRNANLRSRRCDFLDNEGSSIEGKATCTLDDMDQKVQGCGRRAGLGCFDFREPDEGLVDDTNNRVSATASARTSGMPIKRPSVSVGAR